MRMPPRTRTVRGLGPTFVTLTVASSRSAGQRCAYGSVNEIPLRTLIVPAAVNASVALSVSSVWFEQPADAAVTRAKMETRAALVFIKDFLTRAPRVVRPKFVSRFALWRHRDHSMTLV